MAEALLRHHLAPLALGTAVTVSSAGLLSPGQRPSEGAVAVMAERNIDLSAHRSRRLTAGLLRQSDLVLGMTREHVREAVVLDAAAWTRTFTLKELVGRTACVGARQPGRSLESWLAAVGAGRVTNDLLGDDAADDVEDPMGLPVSFYRDIAGQLDGLIVRLVAATWAGAVSQGAA